MSSGKEKEMEGRIRVFETLLSAPGMQEKSKLQLQLTRQQILLFCALVEGGLNKEKEGFKEAIFSAINQESLEELKGLQSEILSKGGLSEFYAQLKTL